MAVNTPDYLALYSALLRNKVADSMYNLELRENMTLSQKSILGQESSVLEVSR
jgi:hypothetical protein